MYGLLKINKNRRLKLVNRKYLCYNMHKETSNYPLDGLKPIFGLNRLIKKLH